MKRLPWSVSLALVSVVLTFCAVWLMRSCARMPGEAVRSAGEPAVELAKRIVDGVSRRLQFCPEVRINRETVMQRDTAVLELLTVRREFSHEYEWEQQWLGSTKRLRLHGVFSAEAGFDLNDDFYLEVDSRDLRVDVGLPVPRVLSVELRRYMAEEEQGFWNKLSAEERAEAVNALLASARASVARDGTLAAEARRTLEQKIGAVVAESGGVMGRVQPAAEATKD